MALLRNGTQAASFPLRMIGGTEPSLPIWLAWEAKLHRWSSAWDVPFPAAATTPFILPMKAGAGGATYTELVTLATTAALTATGTLVMTESVTLAVSAALVATGVLVIPTAVTLAAAAALTATGVLTMTEAVVLAAAGALAASAGLMFTEAVSFAVSAALSAVDTLGPKGIWRPLFRPRRR